MPDYFTHAIIADFIYEKLPKAHRELITDKKLYNLGAQGGDVFFFYRADFSPMNEGKKLHNTEPKELFSALCRTNPSYAAGFAAHYALDCTIHPAVYAFEETKSSPLAHINFEKDLGLYVSRRFSTPRKIMPKDDVIGATFAVYDAISAVNEEVTLSGVERCLKRFFTYSRAVYAKKRQTYKYDYDYSQLNPLIDKCMELGVKAIACVLEQNIDPEVFSASFLQKNAPAPQAQTAQN